MKETQAEALLRCLRLKPANTQAVRTFMDDTHRLTPHQTEELLYELRDEGVIAYANEHWYVRKDGRLKQPTRQGRKPHPKQLKMFDE